MLLNAMHIRMCACMKMLVCLSIKFGMASASSSLYANKEEKIVVRDLFAHVTESFLQMCG